MTTTAPTTPTARTSTRALAAWFGAAGLLTAAGGQLHPRAAAATLDEHLAAMFLSPTWGPAHVLLLAGLVVGVGALLAARRSGVFGPHVTAWLPVPIIGWSIAAVEMVPHLLAAGDHHHLVTGRPTPVLDLHLLLQVVATPAFGLTGAALALAVARADRTAPAWVLGVVGALGGLLYGVAGPLVALTGDVAWGVLFAAQAGVAVWLLGTAVRLATGTRATSPR